MLCLAYAFSPSVDGVENFNVKLFKEAISIVIVITLLLQGTMTKVCSKYSYQLEGDTFSYQLEGDTFDSRC